MPRLRVVARKHGPRTRGGVEEYRLTLKFRWPDGHTMTFVSNDTVSAALMHRTIMPALQDAFSVEARGVPRMEAAGDPLECTRLGTYPEVMSRLPEAHHRRHASEPTLLR